MYRTVSNQCRSQNCHWHCCAAFLVAGNGGGAAAAAAASAVVAAATADVAQPVAPVNYWLLLSYEIRCALLHLLCSLHSIVPSLECFAYVLRIIFPSGGEIALASMRSMLHIGLLVDSSTGISWVTPFPHFAPAVDYMWLCNARHVLDYFHVIKSRIMCCTTIMSRVDLQQSLEDAQKRLLHMVHAQTCQFITDPSWPVSVMKHSRDVVTFCYKLLLRAGIGGVKSSHESCKP
jgi:hypothetical protein